MINKYFLITMIPIFPAILMGADGYSRCYRRDTDVVIASYRAVANGFWENALLYDSEGRLWRFVLKSNEPIWLVKIKGVLGFVGNFDYDYNNLGVYELSDLKEHFLKNIDKCGDLYLDPVAAKKKVENAKSLKNLTNICIGK